jgi:hypothetical protein
MNMSSNVPVPDDFAAHAHLSNAVLKERYGVGDKRLAMWRKQADLPAERGRAAVLARWGTTGKIPAPSDFKDRAPRHVNRLLAEYYGVSQNTITRWRKETGTQASLKHFRSAPLPKQAIPPVPAGTASEACQFLRSTHRPVYHRLIEGKQFQGQYVVGTQVMEETALVEYARAKGFKTGAEQLRSLDKYD